MLDKQQEQQVQFFGLNIHTDTNWAEEIDELVHELNHALLPVGPLTPKLQRNTSPQFGTN